ncbi:MAG: hypothetical protein AAF039_14390 [Bacteroidota bacterium]
MYLSSWVLGFLLIILQLQLQGQKFSESLSFFFSEIIFNRGYLLAQHILFAIIGMLYVLFQYFRTVFNKRGRAILFKRLGLYLLLPVLLLVLGFKTLVHFNTNEKMAFEWDEKVMNTSGTVARHFERDGLHRGMSVFGWKDNNTKAIADLVKANVEWVAVTPFIYQENETTSELRMERGIGEFSRRDSTFIKAIRELRAKGLYVHLKPHLWLGNGWRSNLAHPNRKAWNTWFAGYRKRMLHYAKMAQLTGVELFCLGTELRTSIKNQPEAWKVLIADIRNIYKGKLTYAANWYDEYEHVTFWNDLDYIGVQAYFPLTKSKNPNLEAIKKGWLPHMETLSHFSKTHQKPILFTEVGYRSEASATIKPWEWSGAFEVLFKKKSDRTQLLAYKALFEEVWHQDWFAGVYIWQWDTRSSRSNATRNLDFSPRFKPAENILAKRFGQAVQKPTP